MADFRSIDSGATMRWVYVLLLVGVGLVFYLSWVPDPHLRKIVFIPDWLASWTDNRANEDLRTGVPFVFLGLLTGLLSRKKLISLSRWIVNWLFLIGVVILAEAGQLFLPHRHFSWEDVMWGAIGALIGLAGASFMALLRRT